MSEFDALARYYDAEQGRFSADLNLYRELARRTGGPILELMCGSGRVLLPLLRDGYELLGVDVSPALLELAHRKLTAVAAQRVRLLVADIRDARLDAQCCRLAIVALGSFGHLLESEDQLAALHTIYHALQPGGLLVIDMPNPDPAELARHDGTLQHAATFSLAEEGLIVSKLVAQQADPATQRDQITIFYDEFGASGPPHRTLISFGLRWIYRFELEHLLARAGFMLEQIYGSYELDDYSSSSERLIAIAIRPV